MNNPYQKYSSLLSAKEKDDLDHLLKVYGKWPIELEEMWTLMDKVWDELGCDNKNIHDGNIVEYYSNPVWLLNGLFAENHDLSIEHRQSISDWVAQNDIATMLDYGGGFCTLSRLVSEKSPEVKIDVFEPYPAPVLKKIIAQYPQIRFVDSVTGNYDCITALDVLEHVPDPLKTFGEMINNVNSGGYLLIGNCFQAVIKCHLPKTFHLNSSFQKIAIRMGLDYLSNVPGSHVEIYQKVGDGSISWPKVRMLEFISIGNYKTAKWIQQIKQLFSF